MSHLSSTKSGIAASIVPELQVDSLKAGVMFALILTLVQRVIGLLRGILFCRVLPEEQLGQWSLTWSYLMLLAPLAVLGLPGCFNRYVETYRQSGQLRVFLIRITLISLVTTLVFSAVMAVTAEKLAEWLFRDRQQSGLVNLMACSLIFVVAFNYASSFMEALRQVRLVTIMRVVNGAGFAVFAIALMFVMQDGTYAITLGFVLSCIAGTIPAIWYISRNRSIISSSNQTFQGESMWVRVAPFAAWMWVSNLVSNLYETADRGMLLHLAPTSVAKAQAMIGQYHCGRVIPLVLVGMASMLSGTLMAYMTAHWERGDKESVQRQLRWTLKLVGLGFTAIALGSVLCAPFLFDVILQGKYSDGMAIMPLTFVYCIWFSLLTVGQDWLWCREKGKWACLAIIVGLIANLVLNYLLIPRFGLMGAVWATTISNGIALASLFAISFLFGWRPDHGVLISALLPLLLLLPVAPAIVLIIGISWAGFQYGWLFNERERQELVVATENVTIRIPGLQSHLTDKAKS